MRRYLLDTGILGDYIYKRSGIPSRITSVRSKGGLIGTTLPIIGEVYFGAQYSNDPMRHLRALSHRLPQITCWPLTRQAAEQYGEIAAFLKRNGQSIQQVDIQTAAIALTLGNCTIVTTDSDFERIPGLSIENWRTPNS